MGESLNNLNNINSEESKAGGDEIAAAKAVLQGHSSLTHSLTHSLAYSLTHSLTHSLTP